MAEGDHEVGARGVRGAAVAAVAAVAPAAPGKKAQHWRPWLRAMHRDIGYLAVGLTFVYALSGLAVNHLTDWSDDLRKRFSIGETPRELYRPTPDELEVIFDKRSLHANTSTGHVVDEGQKPRFILRAANWLHLNRGKKAWTYFADAYAAGLLVLALSGMFMIAGRKGFAGRGALLVAAGIAIPVLYVTFAGP